MNNWNHLGGWNRWMVENMKNKTLLNDIRGNMIYIHLGITRILSIEDWLESLREGFVDNGKSSNFWLNEWTYMIISSSEERKFIMKISQRWCGLPRQSVRDYGIRQVLRVSANSNHSGGWIVRRDHYIFLLQDNYLTQFVEIRLPISIFFFTIN